jgi:hypothetical protein
VACHFPVSDDEQHAGRRGRSLAAEQAAAKQAEIAAAGGLVDTPAITSDDD